MLLISDKTKYEPARNSDLKKTKYLQGRWTSSQKERFLKAYEKLGNDWMAIQKFVKTRSLSQVRSHAQKILQKKYENGLMSESQMADSQAIPYRDTSESEILSMEQAQIKVLSPQSSIRKGPEKQHKPKQSKRLTDSKTRRDSIQTSIPGHQKLALTPTLSTILPSLSSLQAYSETAGKTSHFILSVMQWWEFLAEGGSFIQLCGR